MRSRSILHKNHVPELVQYAKSLGYKEEATKGEYEFLRLRKASNAPIIYHFHEGSDHLTVWGQGERLTRRFMSQRKAAQ